MFKIAPCFVFIFSLFTINLVQANNSNELNWQELKPTLAPFVDPFLAVSQRQIDDLGYYLGLKNDIEAIQTKTPDYKNLAKMELELAKLQQLLTSQGLDIDFLLSQRESVRAHRMEKATLVAKGVVNKSAKIAGYIVPIEFDKKQNKLVSFFLSPENPLISIGHDHSTPDPNQLIKVSLPNGVVTLDFNKQYRVSGVLHEGQFEKVIKMPDGHESLMQSSYLLDANEATLLK